MKAENTENRVSGQNTVQDQHNDGETAVDTIAKFTPTICIKLAVRAVGDASS